MATEKIATFVKIYRVIGGGKLRNVQRYHNAKPGVIITENRENYSFLPFLYSGATVSRTGDNVTSELTLSSNDIARSRVAGLFDYSYRAEVRVCRMSDDFLHARRVLSLETWLVASAAYDATAIQIQLTSGVDAVNSSIPRRILTSAEVGPLPVTGNIRL